VGNPVLSLLLICKVPTAVAIVSSRRGGGIWVVVILCRGVLLAGVERKAQVVPLLLAVPGFVPEVLFVLSRAVVVLVSSKRSSYVATMSSSILVLLVLVSLSGSCTLLEVAVVMVVA